MNNTKDLDFEDGATPVAGEEDFGALLNSYLEQNEYADGEMVCGRVVEVGKDYVMVDITGKSEGVIPVAEFRDQATGEVAVKVGDQIEVVIEDMEDDHGMIRLSKEKADKQRVWDGICKCCDAGEAVTGTIIGKIRGGLTVDIGNVKAFLPGSQVALKPLRSLDEVIGQTFQFKVLKYNKNRNNIVLSRRALLEKEREVMKVETLKKLEEGKTVRGTVKNITNYGAFLDLGGIDGLLHITDMSWGRVNHPSEMFHIGDEVDVMVLKFDPQTERVSLGIKQLAADPWKLAADRYPVGKRVHGRVVSLTDYGAFVELEKGIEGLIHISEMSWVKRIKHPSKMVAIGDHVEVVILDIDEDNRRISLGMKQVEPNPWELLKDKYPVGTVIRGKVRNITDFGVFIGVEEGIDGLVHVSDMSWTKKIKSPAKHYKKGDDVEAVVLNIDAEKERFSLGIKQLTPDPWKKIPDKYYPGKVVVGIVSKVTEFGVFVELEPDIEGLIHISELSDKRVENAADVVKEGDEIKAEVKHMDLVERKIALSVRSLLKDAEKMQLAEYMTQDTASSSGTTKFGDVFKHKLTLGGSPSEPGPAAEPAATPDDGPDASDT